MSYVINPTGRSRRCRRNRSGECNRCQSSCSGCNHHHHHGCSCGCGRAQGTRYQPIVYTTGDCACPDGCPPPYVRNVIYTGPCPPSPDCPCQPPLPPPPPDPPCYGPAPCINPHAYLAQTGYLAVSQPNGVIELDSVSDVSAGAFEYDDGIITIRRAGVYLATFTMTLPASSNVSTQISMLLDSATLPGSVVTVNKTPGSPGSIVSQAVFTAWGESEFAVISSNPFSITSDSPEDTIASLTITQIGGGLFPGPYIV